MLDITPEVKVNEADPYRRCYCCYEIADYELVIGHRSDDGKSGNSHSISLCGPCRLLVAEATAL